MSKVDKKKDIREIAADIGMNYADLAHVTDSIKEGMFFMYYRPDATEDWQVEYNDRLKAAFKKWKGVDLDPELMVGMDASPIALMGPPGHGKTSVFKAAAKWFAKETGLTYVDRVDIGDYVSNNGEPPKKKFDRNTFLFVSQEFSGEVSKAGIGLPFKSVGSVDVDGEMVQVEYMRNMMPGRFQLMKQAMASVLLLDDFVNASPSIQNIALSITNENRYQDLDYSNVYIGVTGNLGAIDGTHTSRISSALVSRLESYVVSDHVRDFANRLISRTSDKIGDLGISGFLMRNPDMLWDMPDKGAFPCPRTWDKGINCMRRIVLSNGGSLERALPEIAARLPSYIGNTAAAYCHAYLDQLVIGADPLAKKMIKEGQWNEQDKQTLEKGYKGGFGADALDFAYQFGSALADYAAQEIVLHPKNKTPEITAIYNKVNEKQELTAAEKKELNETRREILKDSIERFVIGMSHVKERQALAFGIQQLGDKLSYQIPAWSQEQPMEDRVQRTLKYEVKEAITDITADLVKSKHPNVNSSQVATVIDAITNHDQMSDAPIVAKKKKAI